MAKLIIIFLLPLWLWSCSAHKKAAIPSKIRKLKNLKVYSYDAQPAYQITFKKDVIYGDTKNVLIGTIGGFTVSDSGRVFIGNAKQGVFFMYAPDGHYLMQLGGKGKGPGEFSYFTGSTVKTHANKLYVYDSSQRRISVFSMDSLKLIHTLNPKPANQAAIKALQGYGLHEVYPWDEGIFLAKFTPNHIAKMDPDSLHQKYFLINGGGKVISSQIFEQKGLREGLLTAHFGGRYQGGAFKFLPHSLMAISNDHHIFAAWSANFLIKEYDSKGNYLLAFYYPFKKVPLTRDEAMNMQKQRGNAKYFQNVIRHNTIPKTWPALHSMKSDSQNRLWISTIVKNQKVYQWWVLNKKGKLLARFTWPRDKPIEVIKNGFLYTKEKIPKSGVQQIVRYKIQMQT